MATEAKAADNYAGGIRGKISKTELQARHKCLVDERNKWEAIWKDCIQFMAPGIGRFDSGEYQKSKKVNGKILDNTAVRAKRTYQAGLTAGMANPTTEWMRLLTSSAELNESAGVKRWLSDASSILMDTYSASNVYNSISVCNGEGGVIGTKVMFMDEDDEHVLWTYPLTVGEYALGIGARGVIDTLYRNVRKTVKQLVDEFGMENVSQNVKTLYNGKTFDQWIDCVHCVYPNPDFDERKVLELEGKRFLSVYYEVGGDGDKVLRVGGYHEKPFFAARTEVVGSEVYGRSPGMDALEDTKSLQAMCKNRHLAIDKKVNPPLVAPSSMKWKPVQNVPGGITYYDETDPKVPGFTSAYQVNFDVRELAESEVDVRQRIEDTFYVPLFRAIISSSERDKTAREVVEMHDEKVMELGPLVHNDKTEFYDPMTDRAFGICLRAGRFPQPPPELEGVTLKVELISMLAQSQKASKAYQMDEFVNRIVTLAPIVPGILDKFDEDQYVDELAALGMPPSVVRSDEEVAKLRAARTEIDQARESAEMAQSMATTAKDAAQAGSMMPPGAAQAMMGMVGNG